MECSCFNDYNRKHYAVYIRVQVNTGTRSRPSRKQKMVAIGTLCWACGTMEKDEQWREKRTGAFTET